MIDWTKPIETVDGKPARVLATDFKPQPYISKNVVAAVAVTDGEGFENCHPVELDGRNVSGADFIRNRLVKREGWINVYPSTNGVDLAYSSHVHATRELADKPTCVTARRVACIRVEWEETP